VTLDRRYVLGAIFGVLVIGAVALLADVLATVFFAVTVGYLLSPLREELTRRGLPRWWASLVSTVAALVAVLALALPVVVVIVDRLDAVIAFVSSLPPEIAVELYGFSTTITLADARAATVRFARRLASSFALAIPVLTLKLTVFVMVVFALLSRTVETHRALIGIVPSGYRDVVQALSRRTRATLFAIYVLQAATAAATFLIGLVLFALLGYPYYLTLAVLSAILQFVPVVGPSLLIGLLAVGHLIAGDSTQAALVFVVGSVLVAWLPDVLVRPRLARETADLPGSLYFVGFVGGFLTLGPVGVIAGPLTVALVVEAGTLLSAELADATVAEE
jgi:predicted PurR-regulated permease PerM